MIFRSKSKQPSHDDNDYEVQRLLEDDPNDKKGGTKGCGIGSVVVGVTFIVAVYFHAFSSQIGVSWDALSSKETIAECLSSPWKPDEVLVGLCPGVLVPDGLDHLTSAQACAEACCANPECITWQYRTHCLHGPDVRVGLEKDGPGAWCHHAPPAPWQGQMFRQPRGDGVVAVDRENGCNLESWDPNEQMGQCLGLGDVRVEASGSPQQCMEACCKDTTCVGWQWQKGLGCFYGADMYSCTVVDNPVVFEPFVGRRKKLSSRSYAIPEEKPV
ncbi:hypothetical protein MHU86_1082 [Fragilaria crotonensis]|nr:hypothetical protein MHU86_1082 [Fragilaria crotonensis]